MEAQILRLPDGDLTGEEREALQEHLDLCPACREEARAIRRLSGLLRQDPEPDAALPSGERVTRWVLEREAARARPSEWGSWRGLAMAPGLALAAVAIALWAGPPREEPIAPSAVPEETAASPALPALVVMDDERTGRTVVLAPSGAEER